MIAAIDDENRLGWNTYWGFIRKTVDNARETLYFINSILIRFIIFFGRRWLDKFMLIPGTKTRKCAVSSLWSENSMNVWPLLKSIVEQISLNVPQINDSKYRWKSLRQIFSCLRVQRFFNESEKFKRHAARASSLMLPRNFPPFVRSITRRFV